MRACEVRAVDPHRHRGLVFEACDDALVVEEVPVERLDDQQPGRAAGEAREVDGAGGAFAETLEQQERPEPFREALQRREVITSVMGV